MIDPAAVPPVSSDELLARFIMHNSMIRPSDQTARPNAFIPPPPNYDLSVTRHRDTTPQELLDIARGVAAIRQLPLLARADIHSNKFESKNLVVQPDPVDGNPNHAVAINWPADKHAKKEMAARLAAEATLVQLDR